ncbi:hypothetical protein E2I00_015777 [Balaenoptera physalus]|uniref:Phosphoinositide phospholipase C n=1 Tax=Balaenoptera physalus TaxID=9770 RepID=A0A643CGU0_BALPH|nr:hypothetical protein E2I00_015777 [Balaenoptera physalus]
MSAMQAGTQMVKLRGSSKGLVRFYFLDEHRSCIRWRPSRKNEKAKISIDSIQEWLKQTFDEADKNGDGSLSIGEVLQLLRKLNVNLPRQRVKQMFQMTGVTLDSCRDIIEQFEPCPENKSKGTMGIDAGFTNYTRSPAGDIFNPEHRRVHQDMTWPLSHYFITSSHNTYLVGDQLTSQSRADTYAWVLQAGCRCVEVNAHMTKKINQTTEELIMKIPTLHFPFCTTYPVILSLENHCSVVQQKKMAQYLTDILGDKLDLSSVSSEDATMLPSPQMLKGKILVKASTNLKRVENIAKRKLDSLLKESKTRDCEDPSDFTASTLPPPGKRGHKAEAKRAEEDAESGEEAGTSRQNSRLLVGSFSRRKKKSSKLKKAASVEEGDEDLDSQGSQSRGETKAQQILQQKPAQYLRFNQHQLSRIYPSPYRVDSSNYNPQPFWNAGCQMGPRDPRQPLAQTQQRPGGWAVAPVPLSFQDLAGPS